MARLLRVLAVLALAFAFGVAPAFASDSASSSASSAGSASASSASASAASSSAASASSSSADASSASSSSSASAASSDAAAGDVFEGAAKVSKEDGVYLIDVVLTGGSGKATVESPAEFEVFDSRAVVKLVWSSPYYDYMMVNGKKYLPVNDSGNSTFVIPVTVYDEPFTVIGDTTAMSESHEIEYSLTVQLDSIRDFEVLPEPDEAADEAPGIPWPWIIFAICCVFSVACIVAIILMLRNYRAGGSSPS